MQRSTGASGLFDLVESYLIRGSGDQMDVSQPGPAVLVGCLQPYWQAVRELSLKILRLSEIALELPAGYFDAVYNPIQMDMRLAYYPVVDGVQDKQFGYGPHTDYNGFTILRAQEGIKVSEILGSASPTQ